MKRARPLKPLSSEHHHALLVAFQLRQALAGHAESAGAPKDVAGLVALARRLQRQILRDHARTEEELLGGHLPAADAERLRAEHAELERLAEGLVGRAPAEQRAALAAYADLLERHVRWEERELFPRVEAAIDPGTLADIGGELERRLVLARGTGRAPGRPPPS